MFSEIFIDDYCNFNLFKIDFPSYKDEKNPNLNILVGRNGSGKSSLLDALHEIGKNNLKTNYKEKYGNVPFVYRLIRGNSTKNIICSSIQEDQDKFHPDREEHLWDKVIRLHTGHTKRQFQKDIYEVDDKFQKEATWLQWQEDNVLNLESNETKWALLALFMSGKWLEISEQSEGLWGKIQKIVLGNKPESDSEEFIKPRLFWIEADQYIQENGEEKNEFTQFLDNSAIRRPDFTTQTKSDNFRHYWDLSEPISLHPKDWSLNLFINILEFKNKTKSRRDHRLTFYDTGFLFNKCPNGEKLFPDQSLSDGEHAFLTRFALLMLLKESKEKCLVLLDEPETHFNEYWKTYFLYLVCEALNKTSHDVFIATHSAMLITDAKPEEIHRLEARENGAVAWPVPIKTYGANVVDIGTSLFRMEADIGERSRKEIEGTIKNTDKLSTKDQLNQLEDLLKQVGPGEWRWKIRAKIKEIEKQKSCINYKINKDEE